MAFLYCYNSLFLFHSYCVCCIGAMPCVCAHRWCVISLATAYMHVCVCSIYTFTHSQVVCRQLGYPSIGATAFQYSRFGQGEGPIVLDNVRCTGREAYLTDCPNNGYYTHNCAHSEDAGVRCPGQFALPSACKYLAL